MIVEINGRKISPEHEPYIIAEISGNHNGSLDRMLNLIKLAAESGADAVKIQSYIPESLTIECDYEDFQIKDGLWKGRTLYDLYKEAHTPFDWHHTIFEFARENKITVLSSPFDQDAVDLLESCNCPAYKIASFEIQDLELIKKVAQTGKPMIVSTGMATVEDIARAVSVCEENGSGELVLLRCVSSYPAPAEDTNLAVIPNMRDVFNKIVGLSDHTLGNAVAVASVALGASVIEKHFIDDRSVGGVDSEFSMEPCELADLKRDTGFAWQAVGSIKYGAKLSESTNLKFRRSLYFVKDVQAGCKITADSIRAIRPGFGMAPQYKDVFIDRVASRDIKAGERVSWDVV
jgi:N-acetylneuraminate synthase